MTRVTLTTRVILKVWVWNAQILSIMLHSLTKMTQFASKVSNAIHSKNKKMINLNLLFVMEMFHQVKSVTITMTHFVKMMSLKENAPHSSKMARISRCNALMRHYAIQIKTEIRQKLVISMKPCKLFVSPPKFMLQFLYRLLQFMLYFNENALRKNFNYE